MFAVLLGVSALPGPFSRNRRPMDAPPGPAQVPVTPTDGRWEPPPPEGRPPGYPESDPWPPPPPPPAPGFVAEPPPVPEPVAVCGSCNGQVALEDTRCRHCGLAFEILA